MTIKLLGKLGSIMAFEMLVILEVAFAGITVVLIVIIFWPIYW